MSWRQNLLLVLFYLSFSAASDENGTDAEVYLENRVPCLDKSIRYRKRPSSLVLVKAQLAFVGIHSLSARDMDFTADLYLWQTWLDKRCSFRQVS